MEIAYRLILYILMANVGYMIFSLARKGFKHYSAYISQLFFLLCLMIVMVAKDVSGAVSILVSVSSVFLVVLLPMFLQRQIDVLMAENRLSEIEPLARWKANLAWSELNVHLHNIAMVAAEFADDPQQLEVEVRKLLHKGDPYDAMTRVFIGLIHFNNRNFTGMIRDLIIEDRSFDEYTFEELLYLIRAFLETTRYSEAIEAQIALEKKISDPEDFSFEKKANLVISRMILFAFLGWKEDFDKLIQKKEAGIERLPAEIKEFWSGVGAFNSGAFSTGEEIMGRAMRSCNGNEAPEGWLPFMRKRFFGLLENREFINDRLLVKLKELKEQYQPVLTEIISSQTNPDTEIQDTQTCTNMLAWLTMTISVALMYSVGVEDLISLIRIGANSSFLVLDGEYFRLFTSLFIHIGWVHLLMNTLALKFFGPPVETVTGWPIFLGIYFFSGLAGCLAAVYHGQPLSAGASAAVLGLLSTAIVFEVFHVEGSEKLRRRNNFSTLVFILVINLIIGVVEQGVDNSAHLGGLAGGALISLLIVPVLRRRGLRQVFAGLSIVFVLLFAGLSVGQALMREGENSYPYRVDKYMLVSNASQTIELMLPDSWKLDESQTNVRELSAVGPFRERMSVFLSVNDLPDKDILAEHLAARTKELEKTPGLTLKVRKGPELISSDARRIYKIDWILASAGNPVSVLDYLVFDQEMFYLVRFFIGTEHYEAYDNIANTAIESFKSPLFD